MLVDEFLPFADDLWLRLQDHRSRWELLSHGLPDGYDRQLTSDIVDELGATLINLGGARNRLSHAYVKADGHNLDSE
jgi:hypothetical protein